MNHFNGAFAKAFPEQTAANLERVRRQDATLAAHDPYGLATLDKTIEHVFKEGDRVEIDQPNHRAHGHRGVITDDHCEVRLGVLLDSGHTVQCAATDLKPEGFADSAVSRIAKSAAHNPMPVDPVPVIVDVLSRGESVTLPGRLRKTCEKYPVMQKLISAGRIRFQEMAFV